MAPYSVPGHLIVARARVEAELPEVDRWVYQHGGRIETQPGVEAKALGEGRWHRGVATAPSDWYVIPASALGL